MFLQSLDIVSVQVYVIDNIQPFQAWMSRLKRPVSVRIRRGRRLQAGKYGLAAAIWMRKFLRAAVARG
ncbi:hypothetical protein AKG12_18225 [Agrobacterium sp. SUL3]|nr:hypothetical protein AKG12_18225 [Agrobacterium sp. SUL3]KRA56527.1 hypothetical protein ASD85_19840 [Rhizobium sp. Root651]